jgi:hypothetical protein
VAAPLSNGWARSRPASGGRAHGGSSSWVGIEAGAGRDGDAEDDGRDGGDAAGAAPGERSRGRILEQAAPLATIEGLDGLSIGRLAEGTDPAQLAFELSTILAGTNIVAVLHDDAAIGRARRAVAARLAV